MKIKYPTEKQIEKQVKAAVKFSKKIYSEYSEQRIKEGGNAFRNGANWAIEQVKIKNNYL